MDFEYHYTPEQQEFRNEVRTWLEENWPKDMERGQDYKHTTAETWRRLKAFRQDLGTQGWLHPTYPAEYGGGGLSGALAVVIAEEVREITGAGDMGGLIYDNPFDIPPLVVWGTDEQKRDLLPRRLSGELLGWQLFTEPDAGSDLAGLKTRAVRDGDDWVISGEKVFVGGDSGYANPETKLPDDELLGTSHLFTLAVTDPDAPRHHNIGAFLIPGDTPGITIQTLDLLVGHGKRQVYLEEVRVPGTMMLGGETQGWQVSQTALEIEHGGGGGPPPRDKAVAALIEWVRRNGKGSDPHVRQQVAEAVIEKDIMRLFATRNHWMVEAKQEMTFHGSQQSLWRKQSGIKIADLIRDVLGPHAMLDFTDPSAAFKGELELHQRESLAAAHPGGTVEVQKVIMARRMGVSRTRERAAPTPATVGSR